MELSNSLKGSTKTIMFSGLIFVSRMFKLFMPQRENMKTNITELLLLEDRQQLLLAFLGSNKLPKGKLGLDPIRIMKALFIIKMNVPSKYLSDDSKYNFKPYLYGPYAPKIYDDLATLESMGFIKKTTNGLRDWSYYSLTDEGKVQSDKILKSYDVKLSKYLKNIFDFVVSVDFSTLLKKVYKAYPEYAVNSVFQNEF
jgi:uncharacterized protein